ncbi:MAG TPA: hypothetical protein VL424_11990, partial [Pararobbsia sp.]|nr:hypothetical protein [Pararobbsia sp.]
MTDSTTTPVSPSRSAPYGSWHSPITTDLIVGATIRLGQAAIAAGRIVWTEGRPAEQGRNVLAGCVLDAATSLVTNPSIEADAARQTGLHAAATDLTPAPFNVRTLVHEYGGGAYVLGADAVWFSHFDDQQIYRIDFAGQHSTASSDSNPRLSTPQSNISGDHSSKNSSGIAATPAVQLTHVPGMRFADAIVDTPHARLICVAEDHRDTKHEAVNSLVSVDLASGEVTTLVQGHDFFSSPSLRADGAQLAWLTWDHPNMPWDGTQLWLADIGPDGTPSPARCIAGGAGESVFQPSWSPSGELHFVSDRSGWWNLYRVRDGIVEALHPMEAEFGLPQWQFAMSTYGFDAQGRIVCLFDQHGDTRLAVL